MKAINWNKVAEWIDAGLGQGHLEHYLAFLQITRGYFPRNSNQVVGVLPGYKRRFNFLARAERQIALVARWLRVRDVREQYPLWPWAHAHPLADWPLATLTCVTPQPLLEIAREAGIEHGTYFGSTVPYVATIDLLLTVGPSEAPVLAALACKPKSAMTPGAANDRTIERLELERRYFKAIGVRHVIIDSDDLPRALFANLEAFAPDDTLQARLAACPYRARASEKLRQRLENDAIRDAVLATASELQCTPAAVWDVFQILAWEQEIDIDLGRPVHRSQPLHAGGHARRAALSRAWLGEIADA